MPACSRREIQQVENVICSNAYKDTNEVLSKSPNHAMRFQEKLENAAVESLGIKSAIRAVERAETELEAADRKAKRARESLMKKLPDRLPAAKWQSRKLSLEEAIEDRIKSIRPGVAASDATARKLDEIEKKKRNLLLLAQAIQTKDDLAEFVTKHGLVTLD